MDLGYTLYAKWKPWGYGPVPLPVRHFDTFPVSDIPRSKTFRDPQRVVPLHELANYRPPVPAEGDSNFVQRMFADMSRLPDHFITETMNNAGGALALHREIGQV